MVAVLRRLRAITWPRYLAVSVAALTSDLALFMAWRQAGLPVFAVSALVGLGLTVGIVSVASLMIDARLAKLVAVVVSFQVTYLLRTRLVFT